MARRASMGVNIDLSGQKELVRNSKDLRKKLKKEIEKTLRKASFKLLADAVNKAPIYQGEMDENGDLLKDEEGKVIKTHDGGQLRASGTIVKNNKTIIATSDENGSVTFGGSSPSSSSKIESEIILDIGFNTPYSEPQHDNNYRHIDGQMEYLEQPFRELKPKIVEEVGKTARKTIHKATRGNQTN
ncbi:hypothetical protein ACIQVU_07960 [Lysinibacillus sp. NPDC098008]|uniref:hypothetical protein n=1 Tax=Lysinibacillus sp. NPDC098008 TaxID=3364146 RepID=UPI00381712B6